MVLYSAVSSPLDRSKRFTLSSPGMYIWNIGVTFLYWISVLFLKSPYWFFYSISNRHDKMCALHVFSMSLVFGSTHCLPIVMKLCLCNSPIDWLAGRIAPLAHTLCSNSLVDSLYDNRWLQAQLWLTICERVDTIVQMSQAQAQLCPAWR